MKYGTAYKQAKASIRFLSMAAPCAWGLAIWTHAWQVVAIATAMTLGLAADVWLLRKINKGVAADPDFLKRKLPRT
jgi:hypothetical protein